MDHDYGRWGSTRYDSKMSNCKSGNGNEVMSYGLSNGDRTHIDRFSTCSKEDFSDWLNDGSKEDRSSCLANSKLINIFYK